MLLSKGSVKLRSLGLSPLVLGLAALVSAAATGCFFFDDHDHGPSEGSGVDNSGDVNQTTGGDTNVNGTTDTPAQTDPGTGITAVLIQPDQVLKAEGGEGVGIFVEVTAGGQWHVWTTCDTFTSKQVCSFDIFASTPHIEQLQSYAADQVEGPDTVKDLGDSIELVVDTDSDTDGLLLNMDIGAPLLLEVYLDGQSAEPFVYWVSDDIIHTGAPDNPVQFNPVVAEKAP